MLKVYLDLTGWQPIEDDQPDAYKIVEVGYIDWIKKDDVYVQVMTEYIGSWFLDNTNNDKKTWYLRTQDISSNQPEYTTHCPTYWKEFSENNFS